MSAIVHRLATELRSRGPKGFARFIALRFVQWRGDVLYERDLRKLAPQDKPHDTVVIIDRDNFRSKATKAVEDKVLAGANYIYIDDLKKNGTLLAIMTPEGAVASYAFIIFESFYKRVLGEAETVPIICNCVTMPAYRGQGMYPLLLQEACRYLARHGHPRAIITCAPDNAASIRGIEKAGFNKVKTLHSLIVMTRWIAHQREIRALPGV